MSLERRQGACIPSQRIPKTWIKASPVSSLSLFSLHFELISSTLWSVLHFKEIWSVHPLASSLALLTVLVLAFWTCSSHLIGPPFPPQRLLSTGTPATAMLTAGRLLLTSLSPSQKVLRLTLPPTPTPVTPTPSRLSSHNLEVFTESSRLSWNLFLSVFQKFWTCAKHSIYDTD